MARFHTIRVVEVLPITIEQRIRASCHTSDASNSKPSANQVCLAATLPPVVVVPAIFVDAGASIAAELLSTVAAHLIERPAFPQILERIPLSMAMIVMSSRGIVG